jgi:hypothetical protein
MRYKSLRVFTTHKQYRQLQSTYVVASRSSESVGGTQFTVIASQRWSSVFRQKDNLFTAQVSLLPRFHRAILMLQLPNGKEEYFFADSSSNVSFER